MKRVIFNLSYSMLFICVFVIIINLFSDVIVSAFVPGTSTFQEDDKLSIAQCQKWTNEVRDFRIKEGDGAKDVPVLLYHKILDQDHVEDMHYKQKESLHSTIVLKSEFDEQMNLLKNHNYTTLTAKEFYLFMKGELEVPKNSVLITFDDGFKNNYHEAYPVLKKNDFTAVNFIITSTITKDDTEYRGTDLDYLSESEIEKSCDTFDFQSHTYNFHQKTEDGTAFLVSKSKDEIKEDVSASFVNLNKKSPFFAFPYGEYDVETLKAIEELGVEMAFTVKSGDAKPGINMLEIPRITILPSDTIDSFIELVGIE